MGSFQKKLDRHIEFNIFQHDFGLPRPFGDTDPHLKGHAAATTFPRVLLGIWIIFAALEGTTSTAFIWDGMSDVTSRLSSAPRNSMLVNSDHEAGCQKISR